MEDNDTKIDRPEFTGVDIARIIEKTDSAIARKDFSEAERILLYWAEECSEKRDDVNELFFRNELMRFYRRLNRKDEALSNIQKALDILVKNKMNDDVTGASCYVNCAKVYRAFKMSDRAMPFYRKAQAIFESNLEANDKRLYDLYNNMGLALVDLEKYDEAEKLFLSAIDVMSTRLAKDRVFTEYLGRIELEENERMKDHNPDIAVSYLHLADLENNKTKGNPNENMIEGYLTKAFELLATSENKRDTYFKYVCEKCASNFDYYGYFVYSNQLREWAE